MLYASKMAMGAYKVCSRSNGEDPACADRFSSFLLSISEHRLYYGMHVGHQCPYRSGTFNHNSEPDTPVVAVL